MPEPHEASTSYTINKRYLNAKTDEPLSLRYIDTLPDTDTTWLGVEYDDPTRGKHSGEYKGSHIFQTAQPGAGAFIKSPPGSCPLKRGPTLVEALQERYGSLAGVEETQSTAELEAVTLGSSNGIIVEAPGMADVRRRISRLERLREIGFDGEWVSELGGSEEERRLFKDRLKGVKSLDMSRNLLSSWQEVVEIVDHLPGLTVLILNHSRLASSRGFTAEQRETAAQAFSRVRELHLGACALTWLEAVAIGALFPSLETLYLNDNPIALRAEASAAAEAFRHLQLLSLDGCGVGSWDDVAEALLPLPSLETLLLSDNPISFVPAPQGATFHSLKNLALRNTKVSIWVDIDHLASWAKLDSLRISCTGTVDADGEPIAKQVEDPRVMTGNALIDRAILVAKFANLTSLNGTAISRGERWDAELHYITFAGRHPGPWGRYDELVKLHGKGEKEKPKSSTLQSKMINIHVIPPSGLTFTLRLLRTAPVSMLHKRVSKQLGKDAKTWTARPHPEAPEALGAWEPVEEMDSGDLDRWVSDGDMVVAVVQ